MRVGVGARVRVGARVGVRDLAAAVRDALLDLEEEPLGDGKDRLLDLAEGLHPWQLHAPRAHAVPRRVRVGARATARARAGVRVRVTARLRTRVRSAAWVRVRLRLVRVRVRVRVRV